MRTLQYILVVLMLAGMGAVASREYRAARQNDQAQTETRDSVQRLARQIQLESVLSRSMQPERIYPEEVSPQWFGGDVPRNVLLGRGRPWIEIAPQSQHQLEHPPRVIALAETDAEFWYNPASGVVRARVPSLLSDADALARYNFINGTGLPDRLTGQ